MGERANFIIQQHSDRDGVGEPPVVVYTHWGGGGYKQLADQCLEASKERTGDPHYFTARFIEKMHELGLLSGVGTSLDDNNYPVLVISSLEGEIIDELTEQHAQRFLKQFRNDKGVVDAEDRR